IRHPGSCSRTDPTSEVRATVKRRAFAALVAVGCLAGCDPSREIAVLDVPICRVAQTPTQLPTELSETSGIVTSRTTPGKLWTHTDSGTEPILFGLDSVGTIVSRVP